MQEMPFDQIKKFDKCDIDNVLGFVTFFRVEKNSVPKGLYCYRLRHGDSMAEPVSLERNVTVNFYGTFFTKNDYFKSLLKGEHHTIKEYYEYCEYYTPFQVALSHPIL